MGLPDRERTLRRKVKSLVRFREVVWAIRK